MKMSREFKIYIFAIAYLTLAGLISACVANDLFGADDKFVIITEKNTIVQPAGTADRVGERTSTSVSYQDTASFSAKDYKGGSRQVHIFPERVHWRKSASDPWERYNLTKTATVSALAAKTDSKVVVEFDEQIDAGPFKAEYRTGNPGRNKYTHWRGTSLGFFPADNVADLKTTLTVSSTGMKEIVELTSTSPTRLAWGYRLTGHDPKMKLAENQPIYGVDGMINGYFPALTAMDQNGNVRVVTTVITGDSIVATLGIIAFGDTVFLDPSVSDSVTSPTVVGNTRTSQMAFPAVRDTVAGEEVGTGYTNWPGFYPWGSKYYVNRWFATWRMDNMDVPTTIDSAIYRLDIDGVEGTSPSHQFVLAVGTQGDGAITTTDFNAFHGWTAADTHAIAALTEESINIPSDSVGKYVNMYFTQEGLDTLELYMGVDTLHVVLLDMEDVNNNVAGVTGADGTGAITVGTLSHIVIYYTPGNPPGMITVAGSDSIPTINVSVVVTIDSTGGADLSSVGVRYFAFDAHADTSAVDSAGTFDEADSVSIILPFLLPDTSYVWWAVGENAAGESAGVPDTLSTTVAGAGAALTVQGRTVNYSPE